STFRCWETAGRLTGKPRASSPTDRGPAARRSNTSRRVGSAMAARVRSALVMTYGKFRLTSSQALALRDWPLPTAQVALAWVVRLPGGGGYGVADRDRGAGQAGRRP